MPTGIYPRRPLQERFWSKVNKIGDDECWLWLGAKNWLGYGRFGKESYKAHRLAYELLVEPIPEGLELDHLCRNPSCVNPKHLEIVSHRVNLLRGNTIPAYKARLVACKRGHPFDMFNTRFKRNGTRQCRACDLLHEANRCRLGRLKDRSSERRRGWCNRKEVSTWS